MDSLNLECLYLDWHDVVCSIVLFPFCLITIKDMLSDTVTLPRVVYPDSEVC